MRRTFGLWASACLSACLMLIIGGCQSSPHKRTPADAGDDPYQISDFNFKLSDIKTSGVTKEQLFDDLDPNRIILNHASVCANRALMWGWNMKRKHNIDSGKIFLFYSRGFKSDPEYAPYLKSTPEDEKQWWYHVAPYVVEDGKEYVLDHGFRGKRTTPDGEITEAWTGNITRPLTVNEWLLRFAKTTQCAEIYAEDKDHTERMRLANNLAGPAEGGKARCYIRKAPMAYWTPLSIAMKEIGKNSKGIVLNPPFSREIFHEGDVLKACEEAVSEGGIEQYFGRKNKMKACLSYLGLSGSLPAHAEITPLTSGYDKGLYRRKQQAL